MLVLFEAYANVGGTRLKGDVIKENALTVVMIFNPPEEMKKKVLEETGVLLIPTKPIKRHKIRHRVSRLG